MVFVNLSGDLVYRVEVLGEDRPILSVRCLRRVDGSSSVTGMCMASRLISGSNAIFGVADCPTSGGSCAMWPVLCRAVRSTTLGRADSLPRVFGLSARANDPMSKTSCAPILKLQPVPGFVRAVWVSASRRGGRSDFGPDR